MKKENTPLAVRWHRLTYRWLDASLLFPIVGSHIQRIGLLRTAAGGLSMYLAIPLFINFHVTLAVLLYQWLLKPLLGLPPVHWRDHVILDRHRIRELSWFDKLNCLYCGYANGLCTMLNYELDYIAASVPRANRARRWLASVVGVLFLPVLWINEKLGVELIYDKLVAPPLGMHRTAAAPVAELLVQENYAAHWGPVWQRALRKGKNGLLRLSAALEQIESSWCPLQHFERREGIVYPEHHRRFFGAGQIAEMREQLLNTGTVSERLPIQPTGRK